MVTSVPMDIDDQHLELFSLVWLDSNSHETRQTDQKLCSIINRLKIFHELHQCQHYIEHLSPKERIVLEGERRNLDLDLLYSP
ncbi:hypothetical protein I4U23_021610 [Adineta vaga]|nr:hypothetical protein I4U23_021610 [Adineta vaga]